MSRAHTLAWLNQHYLKAGNRLWNQMLTFYGVSICATRTLREQRSAVSRQPSAVSRQPSAVSRQRSAVSRQPSAEVTEIKAMLTCFIQKLIADS
ncbi:MAG: hypothetical protein F6J90_15155 [Moorea sp. SIOASIH]|uniref:hypothetical protein n=1 Tax=Moorena sp. SIOASIH TaxID=2607817 RepID=UPI0013BAFEEA|nr:hypothetical protein [Moorena sp. SIOASIH]NEO37594.1 hypothetical protein [Moorena sp. SIOASIH]